MAFGRKDTDAVYKTLIAPTLRGLKITSVRVDRIEHLEDINNKIVAELHKCDIALADLTYARPSVYFEAGYAQRAVPVVYTCRSDHLSGRADDKFGNFRVHFDLRMKNIIPWSSPTDIKFAKALERRVRLAVLPILRDREVAEENHKDEYVQFSDKASRVKADTHAVLNQLDFGHIADVVVDYDIYTSRFSRSILSATNRIRVGELGFRRSFRFLVNSLNEWYPTSGYYNNISTMRAMHDSKEYGNPKYNNIWVEISYGRFRGTSLRTQYSSFPKGFTIIPINSHLSYIGHDRTTFQFQTINERIISRLKHCGRIMRDRKLSNYSILEKIALLSQRARAGLAGSPKEVVVQKELAILKRELGEDFLRRVGESRPGFVIHGVRSKAILRRNISIMLGWISDNGHWI
jgi:hypothetical protein